MDRVPFASTVPSNAYIFDKLHVLSLKREYTIRLCTPYVFFFFSFTTLPEEKSGGRLKELRDSRYFAVRASNVISRYPVHSVQPLT